MRSITSVLLGGIALAATGCMIAISRSLPSYGASIIGVGILSLVACKDPAISDPSKTAVIELTPTAVTLTPGSSVPLSVSARTVDGEPIPEDGVFWSSSDTNVAVVTSTGVVTGRRSGQARIAASAVGNSATATVTVAAPPPPPPAPVASVAVTLASSILKANQTTQASAVLKSAAGDVLTGRSITWSSSNTSTATVNASGLVTAKKAGTVVISARSENKTGSATLVVLPGK